HQISQDSFVRCCACRRTDLLCAGEYLRELCARRCALWFQHLLRPPVSRTLPKVSHGKERRRFYYFLRVAIPASRTLVCACTGARNRKSSLCDCIQSCWERRWGVVLRQLRYH